MNNNSKIEDQNKEISQIRDNYEDEYWGKKYGVSSDEIKRSSHNKDISSKIIEAAFKKKSYSL